MQNNELSIKFPSVLPLFNLDGQIFKCFRLSYILTDLLDVLDGLFSC